MSWRPAHEKHAIERTSLTLQFAEPLSPRPWQDILNKATVEIPGLGFNVTVEEAELGLSGLVEGGFPNQALGLTPQILADLNRQLLIGQRDRQIPAGRTFQVLNGNKISEQVSIRRSQFVYTTPNYTSWTNFKQRAQEVFGNCLDKALAPNLLASIKMEYWDRFVFHGSVGPGMYRELFRAGSRHLPEFISSTSELWHSHVGYFAPPLGSVRRLINLNVDMLDLVEPSAPEGPPEPAPPSRSAGVFSMVQDTYSPELSPKDWERTTLALDELHTMCKMVVADTIGDAMAQRISLAAEESL